MTEARPHRPARGSQVAAPELRAGVTRAQFDADAVDAVLQAAGHPVRRRRALPAGLTTREVEVLALLVRGLPNKEIARRLVISRNTAGKHVEHIYTKLGVSNRVPSRSAGNGRPCSSAPSCGDDGPAAAAQFASPDGVAADAAGNVYIADTADNEVRRATAVELLQPQLP